VEEIGTCKENMNETAGKSLEVTSQHQIQAKRLRGKKQVEGAII
jgi:hypothetical protein